jgi:hypothetical protein
MPKSITSSSSSSSSGAAAAGVIFSFVDIFVLASLTIFLPI